MKHSLVLLQNFPWSFNHQLAGGRNNEHLQLHSSKGKSVCSPESVCPTIAKLRILSSQPSCQTERSRNLKQESINSSCFCYQCNYTTWTKLLIFPPPPTLYQPWVITLLGDSISSRLSKIYHSTTSVEGNATRPHTTKGTASDGRRPLLSTST